MQIRDKEFKIFIPHQDIIDKVKDMGTAIKNDYRGKQPLFIAVLNGSFMFAADLMKSVELPCEISFVKFSSYNATSSTGVIKDLVGLQENITDRHIILIEDIVDTGHTISHVVELLMNKKAASVAVATLLFKPEALKKEVTLNYIGFNIPNAFVVGYGMDYDGYGRNFKDLYQLASN